MLGAILELVFNNVPAQRGLICMCAPSDQLQPVAVRTLDDRIQPKVKISLSIANEAIHSASSLLVADVSADQRFAGQQSIRSLNITSAHVATFGERVVDVFYVTDLLGAKIASPTRQAAIKRALLALFARPAEENGKSVGTGG